MTGVLLLVYPLTEGRALGWPAWTFGMMAAAAIVLALLVVYQWRRIRTVGSPLVALGLFGSRPLSAGMAVWLVFWVASGGFFLTWMLYMQVGLGWTPLHAGLTAVIYAVGAAAGAGLSVQVFAPRFGRRVLMAGALLNAAGFASYAWAASHYGPGIGSAQMAAPLTASGLGFGLVVAPMVDAILTGVPIPDAGSGSGLLSTNQQVGMALGVALAGVLFFTLLAGSSGRGVEAVTPGFHRQLTAAGVAPPGQDAVITRFRACVHDRSAAADPTKVPATCRTRAPRPAHGSVREIPAVLARRSNRPTGAISPAPSALLCGMRPGSWSWPSPACSRCPPGPAPQPGRRTISGGRP